MLREFVPQVLRLSKVSFSTQRKIRVITVRRDIKFKYEVIRSLQCGLSLLTSEIKSICDGNCDISAAFAEEFNNELFLYQSYIPVWRNGFVGTHPVSRERKILAHRSELTKIFDFVLKNREGSLIPESLYITEKGWAKINLLLVKPKQIYDNRSKIEKKDWKRIERSNSSI